MRPEKAKSQLRKMLRSYTLGSVLMLLGEVFSERGKEARASGSEVAADNYEQAEATMTVIGFGLDAILPKPKVK